MLEIKHLSLLNQKIVKKTIIFTKEESKCKSAQFLQWILKDDDVYFQKS